jgi:4-amino-4-deoxy-L-arabinose transferase-like glycosyltransferase
MTNRRISPWVQVFVVSAVLRIIAALAWNQPNESVDAWGYDVMARNLLNTGTLSVKLEPPFVPSGYREPGYPAFVAACYLLIGVHPMGAVIIQSILGTFGVVLFAVLVVRLTGRSDRWLVWLSVPVALAMPWVSSAGWAELMREDLVQTLLLGVILLTDWLARRKPASWWHAAVPGALVGAGMLVKATFAVVLPVIVVIWLAAMRKKAVVALAAATAVAGVVVAPWLLRNYVLFGQPALACTKGLILYQHSGQPDRLDGLEAEYRQLAHELASRWPDAGPYSLPDGYGLETHDGWCHFCHVFWQTIVDREKLQPERADVILYRIAKQDAFRDPGRYLATTASNVSFYLTGGLVGGRPTPAQVAARRGAFRRVFHAVRPVAILALEALAVAGLLLFRRSPLAWALMLTAAETILGNSIVSAGHWRYRATADVLLAVLAMAALAQVVGHYLSRPAMEEH